MRALPNQMSERVTRVGSRPWQACPLKANCQIFSIPISSSAECHFRTYRTSAPCSMDGARWIGVKDLAMHSGNDDFQRDLRRSRTDGRQGSTITVAQTLTRSIVPSSPRPSAASNPASSAASSTPPHRRREIAARRRVWLTSRPQQAAGPTGTARGARRSAGRWSPVSRQR